MRHCKKITLEGEKGTKKGESKNREWKLIEQERTNEQEETYGILKYFSIYFHKATSMILTSEERPGHSCEFQQDVLL